MKYFIVNNLSKNKANLIINMTKNVNSPTTKAINSSESLHTLERNFEKLSIETTPRVDKPSKKRLVLICCGAKLYKGEECRCKEIRIIKNFIKKCHSMYNSLQSIYYNKDIISYNDIHAFNTSIRSKNDSNNKKRENIIGCIINDKITHNYYKYSRLWNRLRQQINLYIEKISEVKNINIIESKQCIHKAGRNHHYDFKIIINKQIEFDVEFKFNANTVNETPQFVSPMKPSRYLESSYEEYYYDNYLTKLAEEFSFELPNKEIYMNEIHFPSPNCVSELQKKYYNGCKISSQYTGIKKDIEFYEKCKEMSKNSIKSFITSYDIKINKLTEYLLSTQQNKYYMLYKNRNINLQIINIDDYVIVDCKKEPELQSYIVTTKTGIKMKILLRWKNGNGIAYPAFQIS